jgi:hypothetical protein
MAATATYRGDFPGLTPDLGLAGAAIVRVNLDGADTDVAITLPSTSAIKTIRHCFGGSSHNIPAAGVAASTGFTLKFAAGTNLEFLDVIVQGDPR